MTRDPQLRIWLDRKGEQMLAANEHTINLINKANEPHHDKEHVNYGSAKFWISGPKASGKAEHKRRIHEMKLYLLINYLFWGAEDGWAFCLLFSVFQMFVISAFMSVLLMFSYYMLW